jgi:hypothetical protein
MAGHSSASIDPRVLSNNGRQLLSMTFGIAGGTDAPLSARSRPRKGPGTGLTIEWERGPRNSQGVR